MGSERTGFEFVDPFGGVDAEDVGVGGGFGAKEIVGEGDAFAGEVIGDEAVFLRGEDVSAEVEVVVFVVDEFKGEHEGTP
jgi:hypothetical protein